MFDYLGVLISIILGLGVTHLLLGVSRMIQMRETVRPYWVQVLWTLNVLVYVLAVWWGMFWWKRLHVWTIQEFLFLVAYSIVLFMLASMLFPHEYRKEADYEAYFFRNRRWFFGLLLSALLLDIPETVAKSVSDLRDVPREYFVFLPTVGVLAVLGFASDNRRLHAGLSLACLVVFVSYLVFTSLDRIVAA